MTSAPPFSPVTWRFILPLLLALVAMLALFRPDHNGDAAEYTLVTVALATHGTPDIRPGDIATARAALPELRPVYDLLEKGMRANDEKVYPAFVRSREGKVFAIHFFGYSALAAVPYRLLQAVGLPPFKCYQVVNLAGVLVLALALYRMFGSVSRSAMGLLLFMLCGGLLYSQWSSPECVGATGLLAGLILFTTGAPILGALLAGLASQQNPTIVLFFGCAPLLLLCLRYQPGMSLSANLRGTLQRRHIIGLGAGLMLFSLPVLFNIWQFGTPNIIVKLFSDSSLVGIERLLSFLFDLNQGALIGFPGVMAALLLWGWSKRTAQRSRAGAVLLVCCALTLALAVPALAVLNWNSSASGMMRYAFWSMMPLLFALLWRLRQVPRWPVGLVLALGLVQLASTVSATRYNYVQFSPLASWMLRHAPRLYHPEPEIFAERAGHNDDYINPSNIYTYAPNGLIVKTLYNSAKSDIDTSLCGQGNSLSATNHYRDSDRNWRYIDGTVQCQTGKPTELAYQADQFNQPNQLALAQGWSGIEKNGGEWNGAWSDGARSILTLGKPGNLTPASIIIAGHYFEGNQRTRVLINNTDLGWHNLALRQPIALASIPPGDLHIELQHEAPHHPGDGTKDGRNLAFFLQEIVLR